MQPEGGQNRFLGVQWRLTASFLLVGVVVAALVAVTMGLAVVWGATWSQLLAVALVATVVGAVLALAQGYATARDLKRRLREVGRFAAALAAGNLGHRLQSGTDDEIGQLEQQLNDMADRLGEAMAALRELADRNRDLAYEAGALAERTRLARDLHDTVNQELFSLALLVASARRRFGQGDVTSLPQELAEVEEMARHAHSTVRELILQLRPPSLAQQGLAAALREYVAAFAGRQRLAYTCRAEAPPLPAPVEEALFRTAQEALNNVAKHAAATRVEVELMAEGGQVQLTIRDNGRGFDPHQPVRPTAVGLVSFRERAAAFGGRVTVRSGQGRGTEVTIVIPVPEQEEGEGDGHAGSDSGANRR